MGAQAATVALPGTSAGMHSWGLDCRGEAQVGPGIAAGFDAGAGRVGVRTDPGRRSQTSRWYRRSRCAGVRSCSGQPSSTRPPWSTYRTGPRDWHDIASPSGRVPAQPVSNLPAGPGARGSAGGPADRENRCIVLKDRSGVRVRRRKGTGSDLWRLRRECTARGRAEGNGSRGGTVVEPACVLGPVVAAIARGHRATRYLRASCT